MLAYHGKKSLKVAAVKMAKEHVRLDLLISGSYGSGPGTKACSVGCFYGGENHVKSEDIYGIPEELTRLQDCIFEGLPEGNRASWHVDFFKSIKVRKDLSMVATKLMAWNLENEIHFDQKKWVDVEKSRLEVLGLLKRNIEKEKIPESARSAAWSAWSAAESAAGSAWSAARSAAGSARSAAWSAWSAAESAAGSAWSAAGSAWSAAESAAESAAGSAAMSERGNYYKRIAKKLLELMSK